MRCGDVYEAREISFARLALGAMSQGYTFTEYRCMRCFGKVVVLGYFERCVFLKTMTQNYLYTAV